MKISSAEFLRSLSLQDTKVFMEERNEIIFVGRSNVWKSSLMNALMQKKDLVKTSSTPGKTRYANVFLVNGKYYFTDLPGYGFAKMGAAFKEELDGLISWYIEEKRYSLKQVVLLLDAKIWPQASDRAMYEFIQEFDLPLTVILSKIDRLSGNEIAKSVAHAQETFFWARVIPVSSSKNIGIDELRNILWDELKKK